MFEASSAGGIGRSHNHRRSRQPQLISREEQACSNSRPTFGKMNNPAFFPLRENRIGWVAINYLHGLSLSQSPIQFPTKNDLARKIIADRVR